MKCGKCLCGTCMNTCCQRKECHGKITECKQYSGFRQLSIFDPPPKPRHPKTPRHSWRYYGLSKKRRKQLKEYIQSEKYASLAYSAARGANEMISEYILLSVTENLSYEGLEKLWGRGEIGRIPYGRTDFYGWRRYAIHLFDLEMRRIGK